MLHPCLSTGDKLGSNDNSLLSTAQILGFADEEVVGGGQGGINAQAGSKASLLEQLKQRMPWNQPQPASQQKQILTAVQHQQVRIILLFTGINICCYLIMSKDVAVSLSVTVFTQKTC